MANPSSLPRLKFNLAKIHQLLGSLGMCGLALVIILPVLQLLVIRPQISQLEQQQQIFEQQLDKLSNQKNQNRVKQNQSNALRSVFNILESFGFSVKAVQYRELSTKNSKSRRQRIELPLNGNYAALYQALARIEQQESVDIEKLVITRTNPNDKQLNISLHISLPEEGSK